MKIAIVVHGRFHAFDLARALIERGHEVSVFTNYPKWAAARFGLPRSAVRSFWIHGAFARTADALQQGSLANYQDGLIHRMFSKWAAREIKKERWDVVHVWSGVAEEILRSLNGQVKLKLMMRGSAHIRTQARILEEERRRTGVQQDRPSDWMIAREQREYELADTVVTLSTFAYESFVAEGFPISKLERLPLGSNVRSFRPGEDVVEARCERILAGEPLRVLYVGTLCFRKGLHDLEEITRKLSNESFKFRFIGPGTAEGENLCRQLRSVELVPKQPQARLPEWYNKSDLFIFPTVEDGYAAVLAQAHASALPILTTTNSGGPDLIDNGKTGWILPIRTPELFIERLRWCNAHRSELVQMIRSIYNDFKPRDWSDVAADFEKFCLSRLLNSERSSAANAN